MLRNLFRSDEQRATTYQQLWESGDFVPAATKAGVYVTQDNAFRINALFAAVNLISDSVSMLPQDTFYRRDGARYPFRPRPAFVDDPDVAGCTRQTFYQKWLVSKLTAHGACVRILRSGTTDEVVGLAVLDPRRVEPRQTPDGKVVYDVDGGQVTLTARDMIYDTELMLPGQIKGVSRVHELKDTFGLSKALEEFSSAFFGNGTTMSGIVEFPGDLTREQATQLQDMVEAGHKGVRKAHRPGVLSGGAKWVKTSVDPDEAQMLGSREFSVEEVCRAFKIPPAMLQSQKPGSVAYASREQDALQFVTLTLLPYITAIEAHITRLLPGGAFLKINVDALLRASLADRYTAYSIGSQAGFLSTNDIHRFEDMSPVDGGDAYRVPLSNVDLTAAGLTEQQMRVAQAVQLINAGFSPEAALSAVGLPAIAHTGLPTVQLQQDPGTAGA